MPIMAIVVICIGYEALSELIRRRHPPRYQKPTWGASPRLRSSQTSGIVQAKITNSILYAIQKLYLLLIMSFFMTYNGWVMLAVVVGVGVGFFVFARESI